MIRLLRRLLRWDWTPDEIVGTEENPLFKRYTIFDLPFGRLAIHRMMPRAVYKHFHDHGHFMVLLCFWGRYLDERMDGKLDLVGPGSVRYRHPPHIHKVHSDSGAWTICFQGPIRAQEGFYLDDGTWMEIEDYEATEHWPWGAS